MAFENHLLYETGKIYVCLLLSTKTMIASDGTDAYCCNLEAGLSTSYTHKLEVNIC